MKQQFPTARHPQLPSPVSAPPCGPHLQMASLKASISTKSGNSGRMSSMRTCVIGLG